MARQRMTLPELLGIYQQFSPEANARQQLLESEVETLPLKIRQLEQSLRSGDLANQRVEQMTPLEIAAAEESNRLAAQLTDPQVKLAESQVEGSDLRNDLAKLEKYFGTATFDDRIDRISLENEWGRDQNTLAKNRFSADRADVAFDRDLERNAFKRQGEQFDKEFSLRGAGVLQSYGDPNSVQDSRGLLQSIFPQLPEPLAPEERAVLSRVQNFDKFMTGNSLAHWGPIITDLVASNPLARRELPPKARLIYDLYTNGKTDGNKLTSDERALFNQR